MEMKRVDIIGGGLAGSEAALQLASRGVQVRLIEMRPFRSTPVHVSSDNAELVCSNSLKSLKPESAAGMLKHELQALGSFLITHAFENRVAAGGALAVDRTKFSDAVTKAIDAQPSITRITAEAVGVGADGSVLLLDDSHVEPYALDPADALIVASGPLTSDTLASSLIELTGSDHMAFFDAAAPIVEASSIDTSVVFRQSRYEGDVAGDYLNAPFDKEQYEAFIEALVGAECVIKREFETADLFQGCQPIEEIARKGFDAPRYGPLKPVGLTDPATGRRPWAVVQLRAEDAACQSFNLVGFQTNLTFPEQRRVFRMIPGLQDAQFARYGVMHRNTFINAPALLGHDLRLNCDNAPSIPVYIAGQLGGTEGYCEAIASGLVSSLAAYLALEGRSLPELPRESAFGSLLAYATDPATVDYQPMHVNFGIIEPLPEKIKNKGQRYAAYARRGSEAIDAYVERLSSMGLMVKPS